MKTIEQTHVVSEEDKALLREMKRVIREGCPDCGGATLRQRGEGIQGPESDYDILVLTDEPLSKTGRSKIERQVLDLELAHDVVLSTIYHSKAEWRLRAALPFHNEVEKIRSCVVNPETVAYVRYRTALARENSRCGQVGFGGRPSP